MTRAYVTAIHPQDVAREVDRCVARGYTSFVLRDIAGGGMLDQERLGAARYAAGLHANVELEAPSDVPVTAPR